MLDQPGLRDAGATEGRMQQDGGNPVRLLGMLAALALATGCLLVLWPFLSALLWAAILVYSTWPAFRMLRERLRLSPGLAALLMVLVEFLLIGLPAGQRRLPALARRPVAGRRVEQHLLQPAVLEPLGDLGRRVLVGKEKLHRLEPRGAGAREAVEEGDLGEHHRQVGGEARHGAESLPS